MKLRIRGNSVRLRLTQSEVAQFAEKGFLEERIEFGRAPSENFIYALKTSTDAKRASAAFENNRLTVFVPEREGEKWSNSAEVGIKGEQSLGEGKLLRILIEKDFACLDAREGEDDSDAFPNPSQEKQC